MSPPNKTIFRLRFRARIGFVVALCCLVGTIGLVAAQPPTAPPPTAPPPTAPPPTTAPATTSPLTPQPGQTAQPSATPLGGKTPFPKPTPSSTKSIAISAAKYRSELENALRQMKAMEKKRPRPLGPIVQKLDTTYIVRRSDGQTQTVTGNLWSNWINTLSKPADVRRLDVENAERALEAQIKALDEWRLTPNYHSADAQKIMADLASSGQIRTGPYWWQSAIANAWRSLVSAWESLIKWIMGLLPTPPASKLPSFNDKWLWIIFYVLVTGILGVVGWYVYRAFSGGWQRRHAAQRDAVLQGEDAELLLLPPDELRERASAFAAQGNFREALRHRYLSLLLQLDSRGLWRYDTRRTNWEHIAALRRNESRTPLVAPLSDLTRRFDRVRYGGAPCDASQWESFNDDARAFETQIGVPEKASSIKVAEVAR